MKKYLIFAATAAVVLSACAKVETVKVVSDKEAVSFGVYTGKATTKAVSTTEYGNIDNDILKNSTYGFGVFAYYSDGDANKYVASPSNFKPNFMYNQKVSWNSTSLGWEYSPLKYWPNETKNDSQTPAAMAATMGSRVDKLTFFAYAPYVASSSTNAADGELDGVTYSTGTPAADQYGIIKVTPNTIGAVGVTDPKVTYRVSKDPAKTVDLLWGVAPAGGLSYATVDPNYGGSGVATLTVSEGMPLIDLIKPNKDQKMKFLFRHALSRINFTVVGAFDQIAPGGNKDANTKVLVEKVDVLEGTAGSIKTDGVLNLNNGTAWVANWESTTGSNYTSTPLFSVSGDAITASILDKGAEAFATQPEGVTTAETPLFADATKFFAVIPNDATQFVFEITYYVQTVDAALKATGSVDGSRVKNVVRVPVTIDLKNNKSYNFRLILGLTSVKLAAEVADWELAGDVDANLPRNNE